MTNVNKTVAERLRESISKDNYCLIFPKTTGKECKDFSTCSKCYMGTANTLADMIEAEQAELRAENERLRRDFYEPCARMGFTEHARGIEAMCDAMSRAAQGHECRVDFKALDLLCDKLECGDANHRATANQIRIAISGAKPQLPEGIEWPRFEDGELVNFGDEITTNDPANETVAGINLREEGFTIVCRGYRLLSYNYGEPVKRPEPEVLDADGAPIKVGDTVWHEADGSELTVVGFRDEKEDGEVMVDVEGKWFCVRQFSLTHRKPDTRESVRTEIVKAIKADYAVNLLPLFDRYEAAVLRELGGE